MANRSDGPALDAKQKYDQIMQRADALRSNPTKHELELYKILSSDLEISNFLRFQHVIFPFIADFAFLDASLIVEVDGNVHEKIKNSDDIREAELIKAGWKIIRVSNLDVEKNPDHCLKQIKFEYMFRKQNIKQKDSKPIRKPKKNRRMVFVLPRVVYEEPAITFEIRKAGKVHRRWVNPTKSPARNEKIKINSQPVNRTSALVCQICKSEIRNYESRIRYRSENEELVLWIHKSCRAK